MRLHVAIQRAAIACFLAAILAGESRSVGGVANPAHSAAQRAFDAEPELKREMAELESQGYVRGTLQTIGLGGVCGVAGCDSSILVAVILSRQGDIPRHILALVTVRAPDFTVVSVRRMELIPVVPINGAIDSPAD
jgi:hypothetical protein